MISLEIRQKRIFTSDFEVVAECWLFGTSMNDDGVTLLEKKRIKITLQI